MNLDTNTASAIVWALGRARELGGAEAALTTTGVEIPSAGRLDGIPEDFWDALGQRTSDPAVREAFALGVLAGRVAHRSPRAPRLQDPTTFVLNEEMVIEAAAGQSIMRLPWVDDSLFVGRGVPDLSEAPAAVLKRSVRFYAAALKGERGRFGFTSYGHSYSVDAVPIRGEHGNVEGVLVTATPGQGLRVREAPASSDPPALTPRETEVLSLASYGVGAVEIAEQLGVSVTTIKTHFENMYPKLGVRDRAAAVAAALRYGLIT